LLKTRTFNEDDQIQFARLTGDFNPMHIDPLVARRTLAGSPVVHGIHIFLWLLDIVASHQDLTPLAALQIRFLRMLYVGEIATATILQHNETLLRAKVRVGDIDVLHATFCFGAPSPQSTLVKPPDSGALQPTTPIELSVDQMADQFGTLAFATRCADLAQRFPHASQLIGPQRLAAIGCTTRLVGMVLPGLHSIYSKLDIKMLEGGELDSAIAFRTEHVDSRFRLARVAISGAGLSGSLEAFNRPLPTAQARMETVRALVSQNEFTDNTSLIVGGSRGLGELTAKLLAAGGAKVILTYTVGRKDAEAVASEINNAGGDCQTIQYNVREAPDAQLEELVDPPTHVYYFATPSIFRRRSGIFLADRLEEFNLFYVKGFFNLVDFGARIWGPLVTFFYPSSTALDRRPANMTEYTMSKAAGEVLCADINKQMKNVRVVVRRLPRLPTDQTASLIQTGSADPTTVMLPIIREVQGKR
jgi:MaoC like domain/short chain dehydrogenase